HAVRRRPAHLHRRPVCVDRGLPGAGDDHPALSCGARRHNAGATYGGDRDPAGPRGPLPAAPEGFTVRRYPKKRPLWFMAAAAVALAAGTPLSAAELNADQQAKLIGGIDAYAPRISDVALKIWASPELGYQETKTTALLQDELRSAGFAIEAGVA